MQVKQVEKWGDGLAVRIPASVVEVLGLKEGDDIEILIEGDRTFAIRKKPGVAQRLERLRTFRGRLPADFRFQRNE
ncbi:AbrB/MazE/SpoVT family DNA-binding domain-containing protein [Pseudomonas solani]|uniref:AbrB/MazE/SpoVT family DNA-binding domain-containing protein n=1 Tax=Pseudomonas solani TaxID=2731552 RepID=UPI003C2CB897